MRKRFTLLFTLLALTVSSWAQFSFEVDDFWYYANGNGTATLINNQDEDAQGVYSLSGEITIPGTIENYETTYSVDGIDGNAFRNCSGITSVTIEEGVTFIKYNAFEGCSSLATIILPSTIEDLYVQAFSGSGITTIIINATNPSNVHLLEGDPFFGLENLHIYVPAESVEAYKAAAGWSDHASIIEAIPAAPAVVSEVTWDSEDMNDLDLREYTNMWSEYQQKYISYNDGEKVAEIKDVVATISGSANGAYAQFSTYDNNTTISLSDGGTLTFSSATRQFESIVINYTISEYEHGYVNDNLDNPTGWNDDTPNVISWSGSATNSVVLESAYVPGITSIVFTFAASADPNPSSTHDPVTWDAEYLATFESNNFIEFKNFGIQGTYSGTTTADHEGVVATISAGTDGSYAELKTSNNNTSIDLRNGATLTFSTGLGQFESIVINFDTENPDYIYVNYPTEWEKRGNTLTWPNSNEISARNSVVLESAYVRDITSIVFTFADESGEEPGDEPGDDPVVENKTATSVVIEGGNYYQGQFTLMDNDCGLLSAFGNPNVYLRVTELLNTISDMPLTITSSNENVVVASLTDYTDGDDHIYRSINFEQRDYGHAVITVSFAGDETYASSQASFDYYYLRNTSPMAACHVQDLEGNTHTDLVMTEGDKIALDFVRTDGNAMCYFHIGTATTTQKSCWKYDEEISHRVFYPHAAGLDTIVYEYFRSNSLDEQVDKKEDFHYWPYRQTIKIPVTIMPYLTPVSYCVETTMELDPEGNANLSFSKTADDLFNSTANQLEIKSVVSAENLQLALDSMATGTKEWNDILPGATTFNVDAGRGKIKIECQTVEGYELRVLIRNGGTATITQPTMGIAELSYDVDEVSAVLVYLWRTTGGSPAPKRAPAAIKEDAPKAIIKSITITPGVDIVPNQDPDNSGVYYSTFYDGSYKYALPNDGTKAFVAKINGSDMIMTQIAENDEIIPANTAVILQSPTGSFSLTPSDGSEVTFTPSDNQLLGVDEATAAPANCYVLSGHSTDNSVTGVGFYEFTGTIPAHKAYLTISGGAAYAPKKLRFVFNNEQQATGIDNAAEALKSEKRIENGQLIIIKNGVRYNAQGQIVK